MSGVDLGVNRSGVDADVAEKVSDLFNRNGLVDHPGRQAMPQQMSAMGRSFDTRKQQVPAHDVPNSTGGCEGTQGSAMAQEDVGEG